MNLQDLPPAGRWHDHACCSLATSGVFLKRDPELATQMLMLLALGVEVSQTHKDLAARACSDWLGIPASVETVAMQSLSYTTVASDAWRRSVAVYAQVMGRMGLFDGRLRALHGADLAAKTFDFQWMDRVRARLQAKGQIA
jgi:NitT/TauT family transport system substrate-binding protein